MIVASAFDNFTFQVLAEHIRPEVRAVAAKLEATK